MLSVIFNFYVHYQFGVRFHPREWHLLILPHVRAFFYLEGIQVLRVAILACTEVTISRIKNARDRITLNMSAKIILTYSEPLLQVEAALVIWIDSCL